MNKPKHINEHAYDAAYYYGEKDFSQLHRYLCELSEMVEKAKERAESIRESCSSIDSLTRELDDTNDPMEADSIRKNIAAAKKDISDAVNGSRVSHPTLRSLLENIASCADNSGILSNNIIARYEGVE